MTDKITNERSMVDITKEKECDQEKYKAELWELFSEKCMEYTGGSSTSLPEEIAEDIMKSIKSTIDIRAKELGSYEAAQREASQRGLKYQYDRGHKRLLIKLNGAKLFYLSMKKNFLVTINRTYNETFDGGIKGFFELYDPKFGAHSIHITADYPTMTFPEHLQGIEFIEEYLQNINYENLFCRQFGRNAVDARLALYALKYGERLENMIFNLCEVVLATAIACASAGENILELSLSESGAKKVRKELFDSQEFEIEKYLNQVIEVLSVRIRKNSKLIEYIKKNSHKNRIYLMKTIMLFTE